MPFRKVFGFEKWPVTVLTLSCYLAVIVASLVTYELLPSPPKHAAQKPDDGLDLNSAWSDLQTIASKPHPFNSRENDVVHDFILQKLLRINSGATRYMSIDDDRVSSTTTTFEIAPPGNLYYLESRNILVKFDGKQDNLPAVLLSAHYDSNAVALGATDNSMAVVSLLQLAQYFALHQPTRTIVLNFNNGEEDGLHGARLFLEHPWSKHVHMFINLDGAGAGGRAALFRSTSPRLTAAFSAAAHPHGSVLFSDVFASGAVRSVTDFEIYGAAGMTGVDYAFYTGRQKYHTVYDSIPALRGNKSLWGMMENLHGVAVSVAHDTGPEDDRGSKVVYFDIFAEAWVVMRLNLWLLLNIILISISPILVGGVVFLVHRKRKLHWRKRGWGRLPLAFVIGAASCLVLSMWLNTVNTETIYRNPYPVLLSVACISTAALLTPLWVADRWASVANQRSQILFETYVGWWILALANVILMATRQFSGLYFITFVHLGAFLATLLALLDMLRLDALRYFRIRVDETQEPPRRAHEGRSYGQGPGHGHPEHGNSDPATEHTPLIPRAEEIIGPKHYGEGDLSVIWILEFLLAVPFPIILLVQMLLSETAGLSTTVVDGSSALMVYVLVSITTLFIILPLAPYAHRLPLSFYIGLLSVGVLSTTYCLVRTPFSAKAPFKTWFFQTVDLENGNNTVKLQGLSGPLSQIVSEVPSAIETSSTRGVQWTASSIPRFKTAEWEGLSPKISDAPMKEWLSVNISSTGSESARFRFRGVNTKECRLHFDKQGDTKVKRVRVGGDHSKWVDVGEWDHPLETFAVWSRDWDKTWIVDVEWVELPKEGSFTPQPNNKRAPSLSGRAACLWADWTAGKIPAIDELYVFMPTWSTLSAGRGGLVEGYKAFKV